MQNSVLNKESQNYFNYNFYNKHKLEIIDIVDFSLIKKNLNEKKVFIFKDKKILLKNNLFLGIKNINKINELLLKCKNETNIYKKYLQTNIIYNSFEEVIKNVFIDYFILIDLYNEGIVNKEYIFNYIGINKNKYQLDKKKNFDLLSTNNLSFELKKDAKKDFIIGNNLKLKNEIYKLFLELKIEMIEIPFNYSLNKLHKFLLNLKTIKNEYNLKKMNFKLRFKKLKKYKKEGMFVVRENTILLDSRNIDSLYHELGHWIYENKIPFTLKNKRVYKQGFQSIIKENKNKIYFDKYDKYEDYDLNSEIFAYWFESLFFNND